MTDRAAEDARFLTRNAVDALPEGALAEQLRQDRPLRVKLGIDPTAPDIHLGHTVVLRKLREFQDLGHTVVLIIGDYTARVGDPSGRVAERPVLSEEQIAANARTFQEQAFRVLDPERTEVRRNSEWLAMGSDELFGLMRRGDSVGAGLPKRRSSPTAERIVGVLRESADSLPAVEVAGRVGVSRATAQRYLSSLAQADVVRLELNYGSTGRPESRSRAPRTLRWATRPPRATTTR